MTIGDFRSRIAGLRGHLEQNAASRQYDIDCLMRYLLEAHRLASVEKEQMIGLRDQRFVSVALDIVLALGLNLEFFGGLGCHAKERMRTAEGRAMFEAMGQIHEFESPHEQFIEMSIELLTSKLPSYINEMAIRRLFTHLLLTLLFENRIDIAKRLVSGSSTMTVFSSCMPLMPYASKLQTPSFLSSTLSELLLRSNGVDTVLICMLGSNDSGTDEENERLVQQVCRLLQSKPSNLTFEQYSESIVAQLFKVLADHDNRPRIHVQVASRVLSHILNRDLKSAQSLTRGLVEPFLWLLDGEFTEEQGHDFNDCILFLLNALRGFLSQIIMSEVIEKLLTPLILPLLAIALYSHQLKSSLKTSTIDITRRIYGLLPEKFIDVVMCKMLKFEGFPLWRGPRRVSVLPRVVSSLTRHLPFLMKQMLMM